MYGWGRHVERGCAGCDWSWISYSKLAVVMAAAVVRLMVLGCGSRFEDRCLDDDGIRLWQ